MEQKDIDPISYESVLDALRLWKKPQELGDHPLTRLRVFEVRHKDVRWRDKPRGRGLTLRSILREAIERIGPYESEPNLSEKSSIYRFILTEHFEKGELAKPLCRRLFLTRTAYYRHQRAAINELADKLREMENEALETPVVQVHAVPFLAPPKPPYSLVGRSSLKQKSKEQLCAGDDVALCAFNGLPGVGKTALAIELAWDEEVLAHFRDGVLWVGLGRKPDVLELLGDWAIALGCAPGEIAQLTTIEARQKLLRGFIGQRHMLLVIDDVWQSEAASAFQIGGPNCAYLVTTRQAGIALDFACEDPTTVTELSHEEGLTLLGTLAPRVVALEPDVARELVAAVDGLPLALVLMGNYLRREAYGGQPRRLNAALNQLRSVEERLQLEQAQAPTGQFPALPSDVPLSLIAVIGISDESLADEAQSTLYALSVFPSKPNTFSEEAALAVSGASAETLDTLTDYGLLEGAGPGRYTVHQTIADYAGLKRTDESVSERMVTYYVNYVKWHEREYPALEPERNNILAALELASAQKMRIKLVQGTNDFHRYLHITRSYELAETLLKRAELMARMLGDATQLATTLHNLGRTAERLGKIPDASSYLRAALQLCFRISGNRTRWSGILCSLGTVAADREEDKQAESYFQDGLALARELGYREGITDLLQNLGTLAAKRGALEKAELCFQDGLALARELGYCERITDLLQNLGTLAAKRGALEKAELYFQDGLALARELGYCERITDLLQNLGIVARERGAKEQAEAQFREEAHCSTELGYRQRITNIVQDWGVVVAKSRSHEQAEAYPREGLTLSRRSGQRGSISRVLRNTDIGGGRRRARKQAATYYQKVLALKLAQDSRRCVWLGTYLQ